MKLTNSMRKAIIDRIIDEVRRPREAKLKKREHALALRLTLKRYGRDVFDRCRALPEGWLGVHKAITFDYELRQTNFPRRFVVEGKYSRRWPSNYMIELSEAAALPNSFAQSWNRNEMGPLYDDVYGHFEDIVVLAEELENLAIQTRAVLASFTTVEKLAEGWAEGYAHLPQELLADTGGVPAPRIEDLNKRIAALQKAA
jgi:hypothetical protein